MLIVRAILKLELSNNSQLPILKYSIPMNRLRFMSEKLSNLEQN